MARMSLEEREARAILDAEYRLEARIARLRWEERRMYPLLERVKAGEVTITYTPGTGSEVKALEAGE